MITKLLKWTIGALVALITLLVIALAVLTALSYHRQSVDRVDAAPASGHFVHAADVDMYVQEEGPKSGVPVLFVHAAGSWSGTWKKAMDSLSAAGYHAIALDMPPLGYSERPDTPRYSREDQAARIIGVLDGLHIQKAVIVAHSFGARAAMQAVLEHPERVSGLVLADAALTLDPTPTSSSGLMSALLSITMVRRVIVGATLANPAFTPRLLQLFVHDAASVTPYWVALYRQPLSVRGTTNAVADWLPSLVLEQDHSISSDSAAYTNLSVPTLLIWGEDDTITPLTDGKQLATLIPGAQLVTVPGVGHMPQIEATDTFDTTLVQFLNAHTFAR